MVVEVSTRVDRQREISRLSITVGQILLQHGAESRLVVGISQRIGLALGADSVEISLSASSVTLTTIIDDQCMTTTRRSPDRGINMQMITEIQRICILTERKLLDIQDVHNQIEKLQPLRYNRWLVLLMIGLSCASFSRLAGGDWWVFFMTFLASCSGMFIRQEIASRHFNPLLNFACTAFVTTLVSSLGVIFSLGDEPFIAMASSVLMLVPGFPLINGVSDMVKGFSNMGIARIVMATLLTLATSLGIVGAMNITGVWGWIS
ncbi:threonine/serine exporter family protein [Vibrio sp. SS-MA-C1-2]|uniref:threonine/serine ThrE exporter family protein n=1 Tax=Vibrio sp. SS-MA-C1-2 TaxID=2908646 RepID=UPI001F3EB419|nr:threonine/serine exporter family protein [Vibrio sp. SS-MA-C1-2]UJF19570.1 threonine/serine exporter family protein [Vibrio sp. SS-MA-C1-2]